MVAAYDEDDDDEFGFDPMTMDDILALNQIESNLAQAGQTQPRQPQQQSQKSINDRVSSVPPPGPVAGPSRSRLPSVVSVVSRLPAAQQHSSSDYGEEFGEEVYLQVGADGSAKYGIGKPPDAGISSSSNGGVKEHLSHAVKREPQSRQTAAGTSGTPSAMSKVAEQAAKAAALEYETKLAGLEKIRREMELERKKIQDENFTLKGEASILRRKMNEQQEQANAEISALRATDREREASVRQKLLEMKQKEDSSKYAAILENHNARVQTSVRRPPPSTLRRTSSHSHHHQPQATPMPRTTSSRKVIQPLHNTSVSPKKAAQSPQRQQRQGSVIISPQTLKTAKQREKLVAPVNKQFPNFQNAFGGANKAGAPFSNSKAKSTSPSSKKRKTSESESFRVKEDALQQEDDEDGEQHSIPRPPFPMSGGSKGAKKIDISRSRDNALFTPRREGSVGAVENLRDQNDYRIPQVDDGYLAQELDEDEEDVDYEEEEEGEEGDDMVSEKDLLLFLLFNHLSPVPSSSTLSSTLLQILAPVPSAGNLDHAKACGDILFGLGRESWVDFDQVLASVLTGLVKCAIVFEREGNLHLLIHSLRLIASIQTHHHTASAVLISSEAHFPKAFYPLCASTIKRLVGDIKGKGKEDINPVVLSDQEEVTKLEVHAKLDRALLLVLEGCCWDAPSQNLQGLIALINIPRLLSYFASRKRSPRVIERSFSLLCHLSHYQDPTTNKDATRIPIVERLANYLLEPLDAPQSEAITLSALRFCQILCNRQLEAAALLSGSNTLIPTLLTCIERDTSLIWGLDPDQSQVKSAISTLLPSMQLLHTLTVPSTNRPEPPDIKQRLLTNTREFNGAQHMFIVCIGRLSYAENPFIVQDLAGTENRWEIELEQASELARDIFDLVAEGPEGDAVYKIFADETEEDEMDSVVGADDLVAGRSQEEDEDDEDGWAERDRDLDIMDIN